MSTGITKLAQKTGAKTKELINKAKSHVEHLDEHAYDAGAATKKFLKSAESQAREGASQLEEQIKARPFVAVGSAVLLGMVLAKIFGRSRD